MAQANPHVVVVIGLGGIGLAIARRITQGRKLLVASRTINMLSPAIKSLQYDGHDVVTHQADITDYKSVESLAQFAKTVGNVTAVVLTSGVASTTATTQDIHSIDLIGTANVIDAFLPVVGPGSSVVCLSSQAGFMVPLPLTLQKHLATAPRDKLLDNEELQSFSDARAAYSVAKLGNIVRVQAAAKAYGLRGARINSVSPGLTASEMGYSALAASVEYLEKMKKTAAIGRMGTVEEMASAVEFLIGPSSSYVTGTDILVDGGAVGAYRWPEGTQTPALEVPDEKATPVA
ncbi:hypothetical protein FKW77_008503 [Venturia effusa]|uniref:Uncharacterized protein n=1 Tax=Venturia effusa TaxID=50376 RepID=A0A517LG25_9PEZI|nr:hypothetical protein FKW77_008503 [Venturia effusa]